MTRFAAASGRIVGALLLFAAVAMPSVAELQNISIGGDVRIRGRYWGNVRTTPRSTSVHIPAAWLPGRVIGDPRGAAGRYGWDDRDNARKLIEQRTMLDMRADFTGDVSAFARLEAYALWGDNFRGDHITGADRRAATDRDLEFIEAYIQAQNVFGLPLRVRIGRQTLRFGKGWILGDASPSTNAIIHDGIRLTYDAEPVVVDAFWSKLGENGIGEEDGDVDFYGIHATYAGFEPLSIAAYWYLVRDARALSDTNFVWFAEWLEDALGLDDYDVTNQHTVGIRLNGGHGGFDYDLELAYQFGNADAVGARFRPLLYGDPDAEYDAWAGDIEVGYRFDIAWQPRVYLGGAYFDGEDNRSLSFLDWINPFDQPRASVSFNRSFSSRQYSPIFDAEEQMSNFYQIRGGVGAAPTEKLSASLELAHYGVVAPFDRPATFNAFGFAIPIAPGLSFLTRESSRDLGVTTHLILRYDYTEDLMFRTGWEHLFTGKGAEDGSFVDFNGLGFGGGSAGDDADYFFGETRISF